MQTLFKEIQSLYTRMSHSTSSHTWNHVANDIFHFRVECDPWLTKSVIHNVLYSTSYCETSHMMTKQKLFYNWQFIFDKQHATIMTCRFSQTTHVLGQVWPSFQLLYKVLPTSCPAFSLLCIRYTETNSTSFFMQHPRSSLAWILLHVWFLFHVEPSLELDSHSTHVNNVIRISQVELSLILHTTSTYQGWVRLSYQLAHTLC